MEKIIFVNPQKLERAEKVYAFLVGKEVPRNTEEKERVDNWSLTIQSAKIDIKDEKEAIKAIYTKMGGLMRTEVEEVKAKQKKKEAQEKGKKDKLGLKG